MSASILTDEISHRLGFDILKVAREWDPRWAIEQEQAAGVLLGPFHRQYILERAPEKLQRALEASRKDETGLVAARQTFVSMEKDFAGANLSVINTTTTETNLWNPAIHAPLPVGEIRAGRSWTMRFGGVAGTTSTPAISFRTRIGTNNSTPPTGTDLGVGPTVTLGTFTAQPWIGIGDWGCRIEGVAASGSTMTGNGVVYIPAAAAATVTPHVEFGGLVVATIDSTVAQAIGVSVIWGTSNAANTITTQWTKFFSDN